MTLNFMKGWGSARKHKRAISSPGCINTQPVSVSNIVPPGEIKVNMGVDNKIFQEKLAQTRLFTR